METLSPAGTLNRKSDGVQRIPRGENHSLQRHSYLMTGSSLKYGSHPLLNARFS
jgi:hypothetical protein